MCGIVGYVGHQQALGVIVEGLRRLEYRGYDSAGIAVVTDGTIQTRKKAGKLVNLEGVLADDPMATSTTGIGHTRWATHGGPTDANAHPHLSEDGKVAVIHNGIIENFAELRAELTASGVTLSSETDTEVVAHLLSSTLPKVNNDLAEAMRTVCRRLRGAFTLVAAEASQPDVVVGARRNSPLVVGRGNGENFLASDVSAFIAHTRNAIELGQDQVVTITREGVEVTAITTDNGRATGVVTAHGTIAADRVVIAGGLWSRDLARTAGVSLPLYAAEHVHVRSNEIDGAAPTLPVLRDVDHSYYIRPEAGRLLGAVACGCLMACGEPPSYPELVSKRLRTEILHSFRKYSLNCRLCTNWNKRGSLNIAMGC